jgi:uncharacterized membrane protein YbhN (UPF0104 family)
VDEEAVLEGGDGGAMSVTFSPPSRWKPLALRTTLSAVVLSAVLSSIDWADLYHAWDSVALSGLSAALLLLPLQIGLRIVRWRRLLRQAGSDATFRDAARTVMAGYAFAVVTPAEVGDVVFRMHRHADEGRARIAGIVALEKLTHSLLSLVPGIPALVFVLTGEEGWALAALGAMLIIMAALLFGHHTLERLKVGARWHQLRSVDEALSAFSAVSRRGVLGIAGCTTGILLLYVAQEYALVNAITSLGPVETWNAFWAGIGLRTLAPFFVMDLGIREASHVAFFARYGVDAATATAISFLMFGVNVLLPTLVGLIVYVGDRRRTS